MARRSLPLPPDGDTLDEYQFRTRRMLIIAYPKWDQVVIVSPPGPPIHLTIDEMIKAVQMAREAAATASDA